MAFSLTNLFNVTDSPALELRALSGSPPARSAARLCCSWQVPLTVASRISMITKTGHLKKVQALDDAANPAFRLAGALDVATAKVGTKSFLLATGPGR